MFSPEGKRKLRRWRHLRETRLLPPGDGMADEPATALEGDNARWLHDCAK
jgi:hypothetical protein